MYLAQAAISGIDSRIALKSDLRRFNPLNHGTSGYTPNSACWISDVDMTGTSVYCTVDSNSKRSVTMLTKKHVISCRHFSAYWTVRFVTTSGTIEEHSITRVAGIDSDDVLHVGSVGTSLGTYGKSDMIVMELAEEVSNGIHVPPYIAGNVAEYLPSTTTSSLELPSYHVPLLAMNRSDTNSLDINANILDLYQVLDSGLIYVTNPPSSRSAFYNAWTAGDADSGSVCGFVLPTTGFVPLFQAWGAIVGPSTAASTTAYTDAVRMLHGLDPTYDLTLLNLSASYGAVPQDFAVISSGTTAIISWTIASGTQTAIELQIADDDAFTSPTTVSLSGSATSYTDVRTVTGTKYYRVRSVVSTDSTQSNWSTTKSQFVYVSVNSTNTTFYLRPVSTSGEANVTSVSTSMQLYHSVGNAYQHPDDFSAADEYGDYRNGYYASIAGGNGAGGLTIHFSTDTVPNDVTLLSAQLELMISADVSFAITNGCTITMRLTDANDVEILAEQTLATLIAGDPVQSLYNTSLSWLITPLTGIPLSRLKGAKLTIAVSDTIETDSFVYVYVANIRCDVSYNNVTGPFVVHYRNAKTHTWTAPSLLDTTREILCEAVGAGGGAGASIQGEAGGAGGSYASKNITSSVTPGSSYAISVGLMGYPGILSGLPTTFNGSTVVAAGGNKPASGSVGGVASVAGDSTGDIIYVGGAGGNGNAATNAAGGGGGGSGSSTAGGTAGTASVTTTPGVGGTGMGAGGNGSTTTANGSPGQDPGGGGGGGGKTKAGGEGGAGWMKLTYYLTTMFYSRIIESDSVRNAGRITAHSGGSSISMDIDDGPSVLVDDIRINNDIEME